MADKEEKRRPAGINMKPSVKALAAHAAIDLRISIGELVEVAIIRYLKTVSKKGKVMGGQMV